VSYAHADVLSARRAPNPQARLFLFYHVGYYSFFLSISYFTPAGIRKLLKEQQNLLGSLLKVMKSSQPGGLLGRDY